MAHKNWLKLSLIIMSLAITGVFASGLQDPVEFIHQAVVNGDIDALEDALEAGLDVDTQNQLQWTPLHAAIINNQKDVCKLLIENGANVNAQDRDGQTPLHYAVESGQKDTIAFLVENEANLNITNNRGESPLSLAEMVMNKEVADMLVGYGAEASNIGQMPGGNRGQMQQGDMTQGRGNRGQMPQGDMTQGTGRGNRGQFQQGDMTQGRGNRGQFQQGDMTQGTGRGNQGQMQQFDNQGFPTQDDMTMQATDSLLEPAEALDAESAMESERITEISLSDPNEISARIATYEGLAKEIADTADRSRVGMRQWRLTDDNRSTIALAIERQLGTEYEFLIPIAEQENAIQTKEKLETLCDVRARWVRVVRSDLSQQAREERAAARTTAAVRSRTTTSSTTSETETEPPEFDTSMWLNADVESSSGRLQLAEEVNAEILAEYNTIYVIAVEEGANKTIAAMQGLLLARNMRYDEVYANLNQQIENEAANPQDTTMQQMDAMGAPGATRGRGTTRGR